VHDVLINIQVTT